MELDLETFLTILYVWVDDLYKQVVAPQLPVCGGAGPKLSDSEVLCLGVAAQWRSGVPWQSERGCLRHIRKHWHALFPALISQSAFNRRLRRLWGGFILIQQAVAQQLVGPDEFEVMDAVPVPVAHGARSFHPGWLADIARIGKGGNDRYFFGLHVLLVASSSGVATGWIVGAGNIQDRWLADFLLSARAGCPHLAGSGAAHLDPPTDWLGGAQVPGRRAGAPWRRMPALPDRGGTSIGAGTTARTWSPRRTARSPRRSPSGLGAFARSLKRCSVISTAASV